MQPCDQKLVAIARFQNQACPIKPQDCWLTSEYDEFVFNSESPLSTYARPPQAQLCNDAFFLFFLASTTERDIICGRKLADLGT